jgi:hypothetical protein
MSVAQIKSKVEKLVLTDRLKIKHINCKDFRNEHPALFWNLIKELSERPLPFDMFLPYKDQKEVNKIAANLMKVNAHCQVQFESFVAK